MSTAAIMMVRDEADILADILDHLLNHVDEIMVADNGSVDGTQKILADYSRRTERLTWFEDQEVGYYQSRKMTELALMVLHDEFDWVIPCDADEMWYVCADPNRRIADYLAGMPPDVQIVKAGLYNHVPTTHDPEGQKTIFEQMPWRIKEPAPLPKVACRLRVDLTIEAGNHGASYANSSRVVTAGGLCIRHFTWRSAEQYVKKIRNGVQAYAATDLPEEVGAHWRMWEGASDGEIKAHFFEWFLYQNPQQKDILIRDPAPVMPWR